MVSSYYRVSSNYSDLDNLYPDRELMMLNGELIWVMKQDTTPRKPKVTEPESAPVPTELVPSEPVTPADYQLDFSRSPEIENYANLFYPDRDPTDTTMGIAELYNPLSTFLGNTGSQSAYQSNYLDPLSNHNRISQNTGFGLGQAKARTTISSMVGSGYQQDLDAVSDYYQSIKGETAQAGIGYGDRASSINYNYDDDQNYVNKLRGQANVASGLSSVFFKGAGFA